MTDTPWHGPLTRYAKLRVAHALEMPGTFSPPSRVSDPDTHYGTCVTHVPWCKQGLLTSGFLGSRWRGKRSRYSRRMLNPQVSVSGKRPMDGLLPPCRAAFSEGRHKEHMLDLSAVNFCAQYTWLSLLVFYNGPQLDSSGTHSGSMIQLPRPLLVCQIHFLWHPSIQLTVS